MAILINEDTRVVIHGITGREASMVTGHMLAYGTRIVGGVTPGKAGEQVHGILVYNTLKALLRKHQANTSIVYVPPAAVLDTVTEAIDNGIKLIVIMTENVPQHDGMKVMARAKAASVRVVGPNSVGLISPRQRIKLGAIGGDNPDRCFVPGRIGVISRSGGMTAETSWMVKKAGFGVSTSISIGGDPLIGSPPVELLKLFQEDSETDAVVMFAEPGTSFEEDAAEFIATGGFSKPLIAFVAGKFTEEMPEGTVFGHAAAIISKGLGKPSVKMHKLSKAGVLIAQCYDDLIPLINQVMAGAKPC
ncbi:MAG: succinate--CoA ligase subunit alpha [Bacillota bacterium]